MSQPHDPPSDGAAVSFFLAIGELSEDERSLALAELGQRDPHLASEVRALLVADAATEGPLERARDELDQAAHRRLVREAGSAFAPPEQIGAWRLIEKLGVGGMGEVWLGERTTGGFAQQAALKLVRGGMASEGIVARFLVERQLLARLSHPAIARVLDGGVSPDGRPWFAMELVRGRPITVFAQEEDLPLAARVRLMAGVSRVVDFAHRSLVVHRDLKPSNILVTDTGEPKLLDFGVAKLLRSASSPGSRSGDLALTKSGSLLGTPGYMSPEQVLGGDVTTSTDVYSLGAVLYELLVGRPPFVGGTTIEILRLVLDGEPEHPRALSRAVDEDLQTVCLKCLDKDPSRRYGSAAALADDLERWLRQEPIAARPSTLPHRIAKWVRRKPAIAALIALLAMAVGGGFAGVVWQWREAVAARDAEEAARRRAVVAADAAAMARRQSEDTRDELAQALQREREARLAADGARRLAEGAHAAAVRSREETADALQQAEAHLYLSRIALAQREWGEGNVDVADTLLEACPRAVRGWEWKYLKRLCSRRRVLKAGLTGPLAISPDGQLVASSRDRKLVVWNARTGDEQLVVNSRTAFGFRQSAFSPDGRRVATTAGGEKLLLEGVLVWDVLRGCVSLDLRQALPGATHVAFGRDGRWIAGARGTALKVWNAASGELLAEMADPGGYVMSLASSPDGQRLYSVNAPLTVDPLNHRPSGHLRIWDATSGRELMTLPHPDPTSGVAISDDGRWIASAGSPSDPFPSNEITLWDAATGRPVRVLRQLGGGEIVAIAFSSDRGRLASVNRWGGLGIWDTETGRELLTLQHRGDPPNPILRSFDIGFEPYSRRGMGAIDVAFAPDGEHVLASHPGAVSLWDASVPRDGVLLQGHSKPIRNLAFTPDGSHLVSSSDDGTLKVWSPLQSLEIQTVVAPVDRADRLAFSRDGSRLASAGPSGVEFWDVRATAPILGAPAMRWPGQSSSSHSVLTTVSPEGTRFATAGMFFVGIKDALSGSGLPLQDATSTTENGGSIFAKSGAWSPDGRLFAAATGPRPHEVKIWDAGSGRQLARLTGHKPDEPVEDISFDPSGRMLASVSDGEVRIWETGTWRERLRLREPTGNVLALAFSPDGDRLATAGWSGTVRLWETTGGREVLAFPGRVPAMDVTFSPDGTALVAGYLNGTILLWTVDKR